jgi:DNA-binding transcriptional regulator GbsR (MarR family)
MQVIDPLPHNSEFPISNCALPPGGKPHNSEFPISNFALPQSGKSGLSPEQERFEKGLISVFAELADLFGNPRSHGQVYGLLFTSPVPLTMEEITNRIGISLASVSMGLRALEEVGAVERQSSGKFGVYTAKLELKTLISGFVRQRLAPRLEKSTATLKELSSLIGQMSADESKEAGFRLQRVTQWHTRAAQFLPLAEKLLGSRMGESRASEVEKK